MNIAAPQYFSLSSRGYTRKSNPQIAVIDQNQHTPIRNWQQISPRSPRVDMDKKSSIIKEEEMEYDLHESLNSFDEQKSRQKIQAIKFMDKSEVNSVHISGVTRQNNDNLTYSCIGNNSVSKKGGLKRSLQEIQKRNIKSNEDFCDEKQIYLQLEKEKRLRRNLQKSYKDLLAKLNIYEHFYSLDQNQQGHSSKQFQSSRKTLKLSTNNSKFLSYEEDGILNCKVSQIKTIREKPERQIELQKKYFEAEKNYQKQKEDYKLSGLYQVAKGEQNNEDEDLQNEVNQELQTDYYRMNTVFQENVMQNIEEINRKVASLQIYLADKQKAFERESLRRELEEKKRTISAMQFQNSRLKSLNEINQGGKQVQGASNVNHNQIDLGAWLGSLTPNSLIFLILGLMTIVAIA